MGSVGSRRDAMPPPNPPLWRDREAAGRELAGRWLSLKGRPDTLLIGLPRGGVAVAAAMADVLELPLGTCAVRKIADPAWPEFAIGAVAPGGVVLWGEPGAEALRNDDQLRQLVRQQQAELLRRQSRYGDPDPRSLAGLHLVVVDDGIATGLTARAALVSLRRLAPASLNLAVPVVDRRVVPDLDRPPRGLTGPIEYCMEKVMSQRLGEDRQRAVAALQDRARRAEATAAVEERSNDRFWLTVNVLLLAGVVLVGMIAWFVVKSAS